MSASRTTRAISLCTFAHFHCRFPLLSCPRRWCRWYLSRARGRLVLVLVVVQISIVGYTALRARRQCQCHTHTHTRDDHRGEASPSTRSTPDTASTLIDVVVCSSHIHPRAHPRTRAQLFVRRRARRSLLASCITYTAAHLSSIHAHNGLYDFLSRFCSRRHTDCDIRRGIRERRRLPRYADHHTRASSTMRCTRERPLLPLSPNAWCRWCPTCRIEDPEDATDPLTTPHTTWTTAGLNRV
jgi:hypothetical protein